MSTIYDVSLPISEELPVWPGDPAVVVEPMTDPEGAAPFVSHIALSSHTGTHVDAPAHFLPGGRTVDQFRLDTLIGPAWVAQISGDSVTAASLQSAAIPAGTSRLLLRTRNSEKQSAAGAFDPGFVALAPDAATWLLDHDVRLIGIDAPSIEPFGSSEGPVHHLLLEAGTIIVENLALHGVPSGDYELVCLPLLVSGADGAPARVVLVKD